LTKSKEEVQKEIYDFIEEEYVNGRNVRLQQILDIFCKKYSSSEPKITRYINELTKKRGPFRLITWYEEGHRYYTIHTISLNIQVYLVVSVSIPIAFFIIDLLNIFQIKLFERSLIFIIAFWFSIIVNKKRSNEKSFLKNLNLKIKKGLNIKKDKEQL